MGKVLWNVVAWNMNFYSHLNMEDSTAADFANANRVCKDFEIKKLGE